MEGITFLFDITVSLYRNKNPVDHMIDRKQFRASLTYRNNLRTVLPTFAVCREKRSLSQQEVVYYESIKREPKIKPTYECRCDERLQTSKLKLRDLREEDSPFFFPPFQEGRLLSMRYRIPARQNLKKTEMEV